MGLWSNQDKGPGDTSKVAQSQNCVIDFGEGKGFSLL